jgi:hypothetical protein
MYTRVKDDGVSFFLFLKKKDTRIFLGAEKLG